MNLIPSVKDIKMGKLQSHKSFTSFWFLLELGLHIKRRAKKGFTRIDYISFPDALRHGDYYDWFTKYMVGKGYGVIKSWSKPDVLLWDTDGNKV